MDKSERSHENKHAYERECSEKELDDFFRYSAIWRDIIKELNLWAQDVSLTLGDPTNPRDIDMLLKGNLETIGRVAMIDRFMISDETRPYSKQDEKDEEPEDSGEE